MNQDNETAVTERFAEVLQRISAGEIIPDGTLAYILGASEAYVNDLLDTAGRPDLQVDYAAPRQDPARLDDYYEAIIASQEDYHVEPSC